MYKELKFYKEKTTGEHYSIVYSDRLIHILKEQRKDEFVTCVESIREAVFRNYVEITLFEFLLADLHELDFISGCKGCDCGDEECIDNEHYCIEANTIYKRLLKIKRGEE
jgi:hypothetical protein